MILDVLQRDFDSLQTLYRLLEFENATNDDVPPLAATPNNLPLLAYRRGLEGLCLSAQPLTFPDQDIQYRLTTFRAALATTLHSVDTYVIKYAWQRWKGNGLWHL
jgi:hypothetical protein